MGKKVLVTGENSYLGTALENYVKTNYLDWSIKCVSVHGTEWKKLNFGDYDTIFHAAGKAHADVGKVSEDMKREYYKVNRDLTRDVAEKAKKDGTRQFIYPSSIIIYGDSAPVGKKRKITADTKPHPSNFYGDSKLQADLLVQKLGDDNFHTAVVRLPMVYGAGSKGNYPLLVKLAKKMPVFPKVKNKRSMIYVENLCAFLCELIENNDKGVFFPQNAKYVSTSEMVKIIGEKAGKRVYLATFLSPLVTFAGRFPGKAGELAGKAFGSYVYDKQMSRYRGNTYQKYGLEESIARIEEQQKENKEKKAFITATVASMIDLFNMDNIGILKELGYKVDIAANFKQGNVTDSERICDFKLKMKEQGVEVYHVPIPRNIFCIRNILKSYRIMKKICDREQYDIVHTQGPIGGVVTRFACGNIRKSGTRVIYVAHGFHFFKGAPIKNWLLFYPIEWLSSFITDVLVTINREDYAFAKRHMKAEKLVYLPGAGIDVKKYENAVYNVKLREELGIAEDAFVLIHVAEFSPNKNQKTVIQAIERLKNTNIVYVMCGIGEEKENLEKYVRSHKLQETVKFTGYREDIPELLKSADAFIFASYREGLSVALMEAMAAGMPVICSCIRGNIDLIKSQGGILVNPHSVDEFAEAINRMYHMFTEQKELFCRMGEFNQKRVRKFGKNIVNDKMRDIYMER